ncbi:hypothetical protein ADU11_09345 [Salmonella enterica subsp. enterica]|nr:hypothetical protein [Salmonella enterica subsp. enterica]
MPAVSNRARKNGLLKQKEQEQIRVCLTAEKFNIPTVKTNIGSRATNNVHRLAFWGDGGKALWLCFSLNKLMTNKKNCTISWSILLA